MIDAGRLTELLDREAIRDCMYRYCRGIDRADEGALRSAYWPDALDQHGRYSGPVEGFFATVREGSKAAPRNIHQVSNILIAFKARPVLRLKAISMHCSGAWTGAERLASSISQVDIATCSRSAVKNGGSPSVWSSMIGSKSNRFRRARSKAASASASRSALRFRTIRFIGC